MSSIKRKQQSKLETAGRMKSSSKMRGFLQPKITVQLILSWSPMRKGSVASIIRIYYLRIPKRPSRADSKSTKYQIAKITNNYKSMRTSIRRPSSWLPICRVPRVSTECGWIRFNQLKLRAASCFMVEEQGQFYRNRISLNKNRDKIWILMSKWDARRKID